MRGLTPEVVAQAKPTLADGVEAEELDTGVLRLKGPILRRSFIGRFFSRIMRLAPRISVELDDIGSYVVRRINGRRTMKGLATDLGEYLKLDRHEAEAALTGFVRMLLQRKLITLDLGEAGRLGGR